MVKEKNDKLENFSRKMKSTIVIKQVVNQTEIWQMKHNKQNSELNGQISHQAKYR